MSKHTLTPETLQEIKELAAGWGKIIAGRLAQANPPDSPLDFHAMEQAAQAAAAGLTEGTLAHLLQQQVQALPQQIACPDCGSLCERKSEPHPLSVKGGHLTFDEPYGHCPACRRDFFPSTHRPAS
jgi:hypothetical protein